MTQHQVVISTGDTQSTPTVSPQSLQVKRGDEIMFSSRHTGSYPPSSIRISFANGIICISPEGTDAAEELSLAGNASVSVLICKSAAGSNSYTVEASWNNAIRGGGTSPVMTVTTPDLIVDD